MEDIQQITQSEDLQADDIHDTFTERQMVIFKLADEEFGVDIDHVREIIKISQITQIPNTDEYIEGVINLRGKIVVVIDLATRLHLPKKEYDKDSRIVVIETEDSTLGMIVDSASEVLRMKESDIKNPPAIITQKIHASYLEVVGILGERLIILLDLSKILTNEEMDKISQIEQQHKGAA